MRFRWIQRLAQKLRGLLLPKKGACRHRRNAITHAKSAKSNIVPKVSSFVQLVAAKTETPQPTQPDITSATSLNANSTAATKTETAQSSQPDDKLDPVIKKAMPTIAAKMENSVSVELVEMKRAEKNASGKVYRHYLWLHKGQNRVRGRHWREAVSISRPRKRGVPRRLQYGYLAVPRLVPSVKSGSTWSRA